MNRRTKIVCTLGPAVASKEQIRGLVDAGMNVARLNFSHGEHADHEQNYNWVREATDESGKAVGVLADLQGPKIRLGRFAEGATVWATGETVRITVDDVQGTHDRVSTTYKGLARDARPGDRLLVDDGKIALVCKEVDGNDVVCEVTEGGPVSNNKGVSLPGMNISVPALSEKDTEDLRFALQLGVDFIALSFVRSPSDVELVRDIMDEVGRRVPVIAKLEKPEAVDALEPVILAFDAIMVARGDLARSPRATMMASKARMTGSSASTASGFSSLAITGTRRPTSSMMSRTSSTSEGLRTKDRAMKSTPSCRAKRRSSVSFSLSAGTEMFIPGRDTPLLLETGPPSVTSHTTSLPSTSLHTSAILPSSTSSRSPGRASRARPL